MSRNSRRLCSGAGGRARPLKRTCGRLLVGPGAQRRAAGASEGGATKGPPLWRAISCASLAAWRSGYGSFPTAVASRVGAGRIGGTLAGSRRAGRSGLVDALQEWAGCLHQRATIE